MFDATGAFTGLLPAGATAGSTLPAIACYVSSDGATWLAVAHTPAAPTIPSCRLTGIGTAAAGITIVDGTPGNSYYLIAVW